ncbi:MAG: hypothetical protein ABL897_15130 [Hyphomicrobium sp.]
MSWLLDHADSIYKFGLLIGGVFGLYLAHKRVAAANKQAEAQIRQAEAATRQTELGQRKLISDLFKDAVAQLADEKLEKRLFAIHTLAQIARGDATDRDAVVSLLTAYVRDNTHKWGDAEPPQDIQVILDYLSSSSRIGS